MGVNWKLERRKEADQREVETASNKVQLVCMYDIDKVSRMDKLVYSSKGVQGEYNNGDKSDEIKDGYADQKGIPCKRTHA